MTLKIVCDGDSVTAGVGGVTPYPTGWPAQVNALIGVTPALSNVAVSGQTLYQMLWGATGSPSSPGSDGVTSEVLAQNPDVVTLMTGLNGLDATETEIADQLRTYIDLVLAKKAPNGSPTQILVMTDNFCGQNLGQSYARPVAAQDGRHETITATIEEYRNCPYVRTVDVFKAFRMSGVDTASLYSALQADMVHPNTSGYGRVNGLTNYLIGHMCAFAQGAVDGSVIVPPPLRPVTLRESVFRAAQGEYFQDNGASVAVDVRPG